MEMGDLHEANIALHIGASFRELGALTFVEAPLVGGQKKRADLLVLNQQAGWALAAECKCVVHQGLVRNLAEDANRVADAMLIAGDSHATVRDLQCFGALAVSVWNDDHRAWWLAGEQRPQAPTRAKRPEEWSELRSFLNRSVVLDAVDLTVGAGHWGLFAVVERESLWLG